MTQPEISKKAYERWTGYRLARRYVEVKSVADLCGGETGYGARSLASSAVASP